jgi:gluconokinase
MMPAGAPRAIVIVGPAGTGKTAVGTQLADTIGARFVDADDVHTPANVEKMRRGEALTDADRAPWLDRVRALALDALDADETVVVACSALRQVYRERLAQSDPRFVFVRLDVPNDVLEQRLSARRAHFAGPALLTSQLATFEPPNDAVVVDGRLNVNEIVDHIRTTLRI